MPKTSYKIAKYWSQDEQKFIFHDDLLQVVIMNVAIIFNLKNVSDDRTKDFEEVDVLTSMR